MGKKIKIVGWFCFLSLYPLGNTSLGMVILLLSYIFGPKNPSLKAKMRWIEYRILLFFTLVMFLSSAQADKPLEALSISIGQFLVFLLVFVGADYLVKNQNKLKQILQFTWVSGLLSGSVVIYRYLSSNYIYYRSETLFTGINGTGTVLFSVIAVSLVVIMNWKTLWKRSLGYLSLLLPLGGLLSTVSRGGFLGFGGMLFTYLFRSRKAVVLFLIITLIVTLCIVTFSSFGQERLLSIFSLEKNKARLEIWETSLRMGVNNLWLGVGPGMYAHNYEKYRNLSYSENFSLAHNLELQIFSEYGVFGFIFFFAFLFYVFKRNIQLICADPHNNLYRGFLAVLVGYLIHNQVDGTIMSFEIAGFFWFVCGFIIHEYYRLHNGC